MLQAIANGAVGHDYGGNLADAMQSSARILPFTVSLTDEAEDAMDRVRQEALDLLRAHAGTYATALFGRFAENTAKLAMIAAISRNPAKPITETRDVAWAAALVEHCIRTTLREADRRVSKNEVESNHKVVLEIIRNNPGIDATSLTRRTQFLSKRERDEILDVLLESEQIVRVVGPQVGRGRPMTKFWPAS
jgi:hypothetical protein